MIQAWGQSVNTVPLPIAVSTSTVNSTNPNSFPVYVTASVSGGTISSVSVSNTQVGTGPGTYLVSNGGTIKCTFTGTLTYVTAPTGITPATSYPWTEPIYQQYNCQQNLAVGSPVNPAVTDA